MKRVFLASVLAVFVAAAAGFAADGLPRVSTHKKAQYWVQLDNAFGLIQGGDLKIAGVRAGTITDLKLDKRTLRAKVGFRITQNGFGDLRADSTCETRPQSLIGEYFLDCDPGTSSKHLPHGAVIPVNRTSSTVPPDLVNDIMRKPQSERLSLIISGLGTGLAGNAERLNEAIRRGAPALRETDKVLAILAKQNTVIRDLNQHADTVVNDLAIHRKDVTDWVDKARNISRDSAERATDISAGWRRLPAFLAELRPAMVALGKTADTQGPALKTIADNATQLKRFFDDLGPFADASRPAFRALGQAGQVGSQASKAATPTINQLNEFAKGAPELGRNLAIILENLDNRDNAVEYDKRAAEQQGVKGPSGYSGLEALLQYFFDQATSTNIYDQSTHILAVQANDGGQCKGYRDAETIKAEADFKDLLKACQAKTGPNTPGVETPDPTVGDVPPRQIQYKAFPPAAPNSRNEPRSVPPAQRDENVLKREIEQQHEQAKPDVKKDVPKPPDQVGPVHVPDPGQILPGTPPPPPTPKLPPPPDLGGKIGPGGPGGGSNSSGSQDQLLDYLMGS